MLRKQWQEYALKARQIAKRIVSGDEVNKDGVRLIVVTDKLDIYATEALNRKFSRNGSKASVHTYAGGVQEIATQHTDGSNGLFRSNGECQSTNNPIDIEVKEYMNNLEENKQYNNMKKLIRLTEQDLHKIVKESVHKILNEIGDTHRGQYMLGRLGKRQADGGGKFNRGLSGMNYASDRAYDANGDSYSKDYLQGYDDEEKYGRNANSTWDGDKYRKMKFNYDTKQMEDMDNIGKKFIDFIEKHDGGALMQTIVDYESGNQTGKPQSPLGEIVPYFEENVLGYECTPEMKKAIKSAYNQWWFYAQDQLMSDETY